LETIKIKQPSKYYGFDHIHFWVGNAKQAAVYYIARFGFENLAYRGLETGSKDIVTHVIRQNNIIFSFSSPYKSNNKEMNEHISTHGDGVRDVAFNVENVKAIYDFAIKQGAKSVLEPQETKSETDGSIIMACVKTYGDTVHTFIDRKNYKGCFLPGFKDISKKKEILTSITKSPEILNIDHVVGNQGWNEMIDVCQWYKEKLGFERFWTVDDKQVATEYSALRSIVMADVDRKIKMPINEPAKGKKNVSN